MVTGLPTILERLGIQQVDFASSLGVRQETVSRWVNGHVTPDGDKLIAILRELQRHDASITLDDLIAKHRRGSAA